MPHAKSWIRFNPTLVRLRPVGGPDGRPSTVRFQSHAGSIEAAYVVRPIPDPVRFQSHAGSIEAAYVVRPIPDPVRFQSHAGSIEATLSPLRLPQVLSVSIPRWFD